MRRNIRSVNSTLRSVRHLYDPYGWNELNMPLTDRYNAGVLDNPREIPEKFSSEFKNAVRSGHVTDDVITIKVINMYLTYKYLPTCNLLFPHI